MSNRKLDADVIEKDNFLDIALRTRETLKDPAKWCQCAITNSKGQHCVIGHVQEVVGNFFSNDNALMAGRMFDAMEVYYDKAVTGGSLPGAVCHNNTHTHAEVLNLFDKGIEKLMEKNKVIRKSRLLPELV